MFCEIKIFNFIHNKHYRTLFIILSSNLHAFLSSRLHIIQVTSSPHHIVFQSSCHHISQSPQSSSLQVTMSPRHPVFQSSSLLVITSPQSSSHLVFSSPRLPSLPILILTPQLLTLSTHQLIHLSTIHISFLIYQNTSQYQMFI